MFRRISWKRGILLYTNSVADPLIIICRRISEQIFLSDAADIFDSCFNGQIMLRQLTDLNFKMIPSLPAAKEISRLEF